MIQKCSFALLYFWENMSFTTVWAEKQKKISAPFKDGAEMGKYMYCTK